MLVVGHNCPGCGLDTPSVACAACGEGVVWDRECGSHCSACGQSASIITCPECGLSAEIDKRPSSPLPQPRVSLEEDAEDMPTPPPAWRTRLSSMPLRTLAVGSVVALHGLAIALLLGTYDGARPAPGGDVAVAHAVGAPTPDRLRGPVQLSLDAKPVPLQLPPPSEMPPVPFTEPRLEPTPPPPSVVTRVEAPRPAPRSQSWLQRALRSDRSYSSASQHFPADAPGTGR